MRGTPRRTACRSRPTRIIPAHAGNSLELWVTHYRKPDHPRACGELFQRTAPDDFDLGSSPRMRGTPRQRSRRPPRRRIIPAHAGNSTTHRVDHRLATDHPRACGELPAIATERATEFGSSPRMRGTHGAVVLHRKIGRIIPAHAGNSRPGDTLLRVSPDHPRACGELCTPPLVMSGYAGSSPRMRGTPVPGILYVVFLRIIPAHAGNSPGADRGLHRAVTDHPRACGELFRVDDFARSGLMADHPRACGELCPRAAGRRGPFGSSPRMRGTQSHPYGNMRLIVGSSPRMRGTRARAWRRRSP